MTTQKNVLDSIWDKIILTPFIGEKERIGLTKCYYEKTSDFEKLRMTQEIRFGFCTDEFLKENDL